MRKSRAVHQGFAAISAVFLLVVLSALGAFMLTFSNAQQLSSAQDVMGTKAYWAARAGLEWGLASAVAGSACPAPTTLALDGFGVTVDCSSRVHVEAGANKTIFRIKAMAVAGAGTGSVSQVERSVSAMLEQ